MTDRELLTLAAKAAGYELRWNEAERDEYGVPMLGESEWCWIPSAKPPHNRRKSDQMSGEIWNPLDDDGHALRLAVQLGLAVSVEYQVNSTVALWGPPTGGVREPHGDNPYAATCRAIVRAAAEIGRSMP